jgi:hypothetical protein
MTAGGASYAGASAGMSAWNVGPTWICSVSSAAPVRVCMRFGRSGKHQHRAASTTSTTANNTAHRLGRRANDDHLLPVVIFIIIFLIVPISCAGLPHAAAPSLHDAGQRAAVALNPCTLGPALSLPHRQHKAIGARK